jgi:carbon-monoxide dehydrogenase large subunit
MSRTVLGHSIQRVEDTDALTGAAQFVDDLATARGAAWAVFVRSDDAHGKLRGVDLSGALAMPGVIAAYTDSDLGLPPAKAMGGDGKMDRPRLARDRVRFVGEPVAVVIADTRAQATDAAEPVVVDVGPLPVVVDPDEAVTAGAPLLFPEFESNATRPVPPATGGEFANADVVMTARIVHPRVAPVPMEPNGCLADYDGET